MPFDSALHLKQTVSGNPSRAAETVLEADRSNTTIPVAELAKIFRFTVKENSFNDDYLYCTKTLAELIKQAGLYDVHHRKEYPVLPLYDYCMRFFKEIYTDDLDWETQTNLAAFVFAVAHYYQREQNPFQHLFEPDFEDIEESEIFSFLNWLGQTIYPVVYGQEEITVKVTDFADFEQTFNFRFLQENKQLLKAIGARTFLPFNETSYLKGFNQRLTNLLVAAKLHDEIDNPYRIQQMKLSEFKKGNFFNACSQVGKDLRRLRVNSNRIYSQALLEYADDKTSPVPAQTVLKQLKFDLSVLIREDLKQPNLLTD
jgi:hypothetical protein